MLRATSNGSIELAAALKRLRRKRRCEIELRFSERQFETCESFLSTMPDVDPQALEEQPAAVALPLLRWALQHDMAHAERMVDDSLVEDVIAQILDTAARDVSRFFINVMPGEDLPSSLPWGAWNNVFGATFEFAIASLHPNGSLLIVLQDED